MLACGGRGQHVERRRLARIRWDARARTELQSGREASETPQVTLERILADAEVPPEKRAELLSDRE